MDFFGPIVNLWCTFAGNKMLAAVMAGVAAVALILMFLVDEGGGYISSTLRIFFGAGLLIALPWMVSLIFGVPVACGGGGFGSGFGGGFTMATPVVVADVPVHAPGIG